MLLLQHYTKIYLILATLMLISLKVDYLPNNLLHILGFILIIIAIFAYGYKKAPQEEIYIKFSLGLFFVLAISAFIGPIFFYLWKFTNFAIISILLILFINTKNPNFYFNKIKINLSHILLLIYIILFTLLIYIIFTTQSTDNIISVWDLLPKYFIFLFLLATIIAIISKNKWLIGIHFILFFCLSSIIYKLGFGFDQFIHEATQKYIINNGTITPKPLQYIGLYSINIFIYKLTGIPINILNGYLLPFITFIIPAGAMLMLKKITKKENILPVFGLLLLPFSYFIVTTPQGLANLFLIMIIFLSFTDFKKIWLAIATFFIHPITGIFAIFYLLIDRTKYKKIFIILGILTLPTAFILLSYKITGKIILNTNFIQAMQQYYNLIFNNGIKQNYNLWLDIFYLFKSLIIPIIILISITIAYIKRNTIKTTPILMFFLTIFSFIITASVADFSYLITYEQQNFSIRIFEISIIFLIPYFLISLQLLYNKIKKEPIAFRLISLIFFSLLITANFYLTYPRHDNYENFKGKNLSLYMLDAVEKIKNNANGEDYIVLTDQSISSAALKIDGFKKYYNTKNGPVFYYPIPTGEILYQKFLDIVYNKSGITALNEAKNITGADIAYIALPSYWENYKKIKEDLKTNMKTIFEDDNIIILRL